MMFKINIPTNFRNKYKPNEIILDIKISAHFNENMTRA